ncbi:MAG TPA: glycosyltransferase family 2 protein [Bradyrhizobium sp.]|nr:glycosyltransferase family 2 protein [Bradyrhizobium sp.]
MTLLVRDEEDILASNLDFHLRQGVDFFIVTDNLSVDSTPDILQDYVRAGVAQYLYEGADDFSQHRWVTRMARMAAVDYAADWVINSDADELWLAADGSQTVKDALDLIPLETRALSAQRFNFAPLRWERHANPIEQMVLRDRGSKGFMGEPLPAKIAHRAFADITIEQGNHEVTRDGNRLPWAEGALRIFHYPLRFYQQFENKIAKGGAAYARNTELPSSCGHAWRALYGLWQTGELPSYFRRQVPSSEELQEQLQNGTLVIDQSAADVLNNSGLLSQEGNK